MKPRLEREGKGGVETAEWLHYYRFADFEASLGHPYQCNVMAAAHAFQAMSCFCMPCIFFVSNKSALLIEVGCVNFSSWCFESVSTVVWVTSGVREAVMAEPNLSLS